MISDDAVCLLDMLQEILERDGELHLRHVDLPPGRLGLAHFRQRLVTLARGLDRGEWRGTLGHELMHLKRGPVAREHAEAEEEEVQRETAAMLVPPGPALAQLGREWSDGEIQEFASRFVVDRDTIETALDQAGVPETPARGSVPVPRLPVFIELGSASRR